MAKLRLSHEETMEHIELAQNGNEQAFERLVKYNERLVWSVVQRYAKRGYEKEDLFQIGIIGLIKSINKFNLTYSVKFSTYAVPVIQSEIQHFIRDDGSLKVPRSLKNLSYKLFYETEKYLKEYGHYPTLKYLSDTLAIPVNDIHQAQLASAPAQSIYETVYEKEGGPIALIDMIEDSQNNWVEHSDLRQIIETLSSQEQDVIRMRYFEDMTQTDVANKIGVSQVQVSRIEKRILNNLRKQYQTNQEGNHMSIKKDRIIQLLQETEKTVTEISKEVGASSAYVSQLSNRYRDQKVAEKLRKRARDKISTNLKHHPQNKQSQVERSSTPVIEKKEPVTNDQPKQKEATIDVSFKRSLSYKGEGKLTQQQAIEELHKAISYLGTFDKHESVMLSIHIHK